MGSIAEYIKMAIQNIRNNKGRSFLTMLGIIIGIASVIMIVAVGSGVTASLSKEMEKVGGGQAYIYISDNGQKEGASITQEDMDAIKTIDGVKDMSPYMRYGAATKTGKGEFTADLTGGTATMLQYEPGKLYAGKLFTDDDVLSQNKVCVISDTDARKLYGSEDVIGMSMELENNKGVSQSYRIVGLIKNPENTPLIRYSREGSVTVYVPWTTIERLQGENAGEDGFSYAYLYMDKKRKTKPIVDQAIKRLNSRHAAPSEEEWFRAEDFQDQLGQINQILSIVTTFIAFVGAISLLVGGIGVMNIMLVSVTERTREIGIRKALGAKTASIMTQFLAESAILALVGGVIGIVIGLMGASLIGLVIGSMLKITVSPGISLFTVLAVVAFSSAVGIFFGLYPARKAAKMNPIQALRRE